MKIDLNAADSIDINGIAAEQSFNREQVQEVEQEQEQQQEVEKEKEKGNLFHTNLNFFFIFQRQNSLPCHEILT